MRFESSQSAAASEGDMTPMIDMTFQLIAFFMVLLNFSEADQSDLVKLPKSVLARPADAPFEYPIFVQLTKEKTVVLGGEELPLAALKPHMIRESEFLKLKKKSAADATVIIRADANAPMGVVQEVIQVCQETQFEKFALRAEEDAKY